MQDTVKQLLDEDFWLRALCFLACIPSGGALLAKVFGIASLQFVTVFIFIPCVIFLAAVWLWSGQNGRSYLHRGITLGFWGGLYGTLGYDAIRVPFLVLLGQRVFAPISVYGIWLADAGLSSRLTELLGWGYHFSNGITFGIMYALFMRKRHWLWAILWAFLLETIAIASPFAQIFNLAGNYSAIGIAYLGHLAYGLPLGWVIYRDNNPSENNQGFTNVAIPLAGFLLMAFIVLSPLVRPSWIARDERTLPNTLLVEEKRLNPDWVRIDSGESVTIQNNGPQDEMITNKSNNTTYPIASGASESIQFSSTGIFQFFVETDGRTKSSFVIVEPVEQLP